MAMSKKQRVHWLKKNGTPENKELLSKCMKEVVYAEAKKNVGEAKYWQDYIDAMLTEVPRWKKNKKLRDIPNSEFKWDDASIKDMLPEE